jgi:tetratricopeptide (TPR) repeat protein
VVNIEGGESPPLRVIMDNNNNSGRDQFIINNPTGKIAIGGSDAQREIIVSGVGSIPPNFETYWVDRATYQTALTDRLNANPVTEIVALGGFGKSSLAAWAHETVKGDFKKRVWVSFGQEPPKSFDQFARWVLQEIGFPNKAPKTDEATLLRELLYRLNDPNTPVKTLVVMDQLEAIHKADDWQCFKEFLEKWSVEGKVSRILVTTRSRILAQDPIDLGGMNVAEGTVFFEGEGLTGDRFPDLIDLAGGHPLLLKLAATWTRETYGARVDDRAIDFFSKLFANDQIDPKAGVEAIFGLIFGALPIGLQDLLCGVSVYRLPFGVAMAQAIGPSVTIEDLELLGDRGLLLRQGEGFTLHPLVAELVRSRVTEEARVAGHEGAIAYYSANFQEWDGTIESCREELESFYHACELGQYQRADKMLDRCVDMLDRAGYYRELLEVHERLTAGWQAQILTNRLEEKQELGWAWERLGSYYRYMGQFQNAIVSYEKAQQIFIEIDNVKGKAAALNGLGNTHRSFGRYKQSVAYIQQALEIYHTIGDHGGKAACLSNLGLAHNALGEHKEAIICHEKSLTIDRKSKDRHGEAKSLMGLGNACNSLGKNKQAIELLEESLKIMREIGDRNGEADSLGNLGIVYMNLGYYQKAIDVYQRTLEIDCEIGDHHGKTHSLWNLGIAHYFLGQYQYSIDFSQRFIEIADKQKICHQKMTVFCYLTHIYIQRGWLKAARYNCNQAYCIWKEFQYPGAKLPPWLWTLLLYPLLISTLYLVSIRKYFERPPRYLWFAVALVIVFLILLLKR